MALFFLFLVTVKVFGYKTCPHVYNIHKTLPTLPVFLFKSKDFHERGRYSL